MGSTVMAQEQTAPNNAAQNVNPFVFQDVNFYLGQFEIADREIWQVRSTTWGGYTAEDPTVNFDAANGAFEWHGLVISGCRVYTDEDGQQRPLVAPAVLEAIFSATMTKMSLYQREMYLRGVVHNMPTTTTTLPPQASSSDEGAFGGGMMIIIIAAVAVLLLIGIIVVVMKGGNNGKDGGAKSSEARGVVAFENPMYDDPNAGSAPAAAGGGAGLYDEPTFEGEAGKANPMYDNNEKTEGGEGGGYLDVTPDDEDDDDDDGEEDE